MDTEIIKIYGNRVRVRVCGILWHRNQILLVNHKRLRKGEFWAPPGGGLEFGEPLETALKREFREETGLSVSPGAFLFGCEFIRGELHAVELFFEAHASGGRLEAGFDPELPLIENVTYASEEWLLSKTPEALHGIFRFARTPMEFAKLRGFYRI